MQEGHRCHTLQHDVLTHSCLFYTPSLPLISQAARARSASLANYSQFSSNSSRRISLKGKTIFISGASRGIGLAIALRAARDGANIIVAAKTTEAQPNLPGTIYTAAEEIEKAGGKALPVVCDIRSEESVKAAIEAGVKKFGGIDILVNK